MLDKEARIEKLPSNECFVEGRRPPFCGQVSDLKLNSHEMTTVSNVLDKN
jgi:hypothetical protein